jgi:hypothetical protein
MKRAKMIIPRAPLDTLARPLAGDGANGKPRGTRHGVNQRATAVLKDAIIYAAQIVGDEYSQSKEDGYGVGGLVSYLTEIARTEPKSFTTLLARVLPLHVQTTTTEQVTYRSSEEVRQELEKQGIFIERFYT